ncbi:hypothetical protein IW262DRAFT_1299873 [Armillaria fumosa]|nr:hypothetical protein IW262DRAFT_1299873 [Armillaria fumosa]
MSVIHSFVEPDVLQPSLYLVARNLKVVASVTWRFRGLCLPWLYRDVTWFWKDIDEHFRFISDPLWIYVGKFRLMESLRRYPNIPGRREVFLYSEDLASRALAEQLARAVDIPRMTDLREFCFDLDATYWPEPWQFLLETIALSRTLKSLEIPGQWQALLPLNMNEVLIRRFRYSPYVSTLYRSRHDQIQIREKAPAYLSLFRSLSGNARHSRRLELLCSMTDSCTHLRSISYLFLAQEIGLHWHWVTWCIEKDNDGVPRLIAFDSGRKRTNIGNSIPPINPRTYDAQLNCGGEIEDIQTRVHSFKSCRIVPRCSEPNIDEGPGYSCGDDSVYAESILYSFGDNTELYSDYVQI